VISSCPVPLHLHTCSPAKLRGSNHYGNSLHLRRFSITRYNPTSSTYSRDNAFRLKSRTASPSMRALPSFLSRVPTTSEQKLNRTTNPNKQVRSLLTTPHRDPLLQNHPVPLPRRAIQDQGLVQYPRPRREARTRRKGPMRKTRSLLATDKCPSKPAGTQSSLASSARNANKLLHWHLHRQPMTVFQPPMKFLHSNWMSTRRPYRASISLQPPFIMGYRG
jgi:hypothetical protein